MRFSLFARAAVTAAAFFVVSGVAQARQVTDLTGTTVEVPDHPKRVLLGEGRFVFAMALLDRENPVERIVGWQGDLKQQDPYAWNQLITRFPAADKVPLIGKASEASVSPEKIVSLQPDVAIFGLGGHGPGANNPMVNALRESGIPIVFVDFRQSPIANTVASMRILGQALDREAQANAYVSFYEEHLARIRKIVDGVPAAQRPTVFVEMLAGVWPACCHTTGKGGVGDMVDFTGGINLAGPVVPGAIGDVSMEFLLDKQPEVYIATGARSDPGRPGLLAGPGVTPEVSANSLKTLLARDGIRELNVVGKQRTYGLWHAFYNSPYNIAALEAMTTWFHPQQAAALNPEATLREIYSRFLSIDGTGTYWTTPVAGSVAAAGAVPAATSVKTPTLAPLAPSAAAK